MPEGHGYSLSYILIHLVCASVCLTRQFCWKSRQNRPLHFLWQNRWRYKFGAAGGGGGETHASHRSVCLCVAWGSLTMSQPPSSSSSSSWNPRFRVWSPDPRLQLEVPKPGLNPGSSKPNIGVSSLAPGPGLDPRAAWGSQTRSQSRFFESNDWGLKSRSNFG